MDRDSAGTSPPGHTQPAPGCKDSRAVSAVSATLSRNTGGTQHGVGRAQKRKKKSSICWNREQFQLEIAKFQLKLISSLGFFCQVCIPDTSCNNQMKNGRRKRKAAASCPHLFYTLQKTNFRNPPGTDWEGDLESRDLQHKIPPQPPPLSGNLRHHRRTQPLCYSPASKEHDNEESSIQICGSTARSPTMLLTVLPTQPALPPSGAPLGKPVETLVNTEATAMLLAAAPPLQNGRIRQWGYNQLSWLSLPAQGT